MTIKLISIFTLILSCITVVHAQEEVAGKSYRVQTGETCKEMTDGGCMIYTYKVLNFKADSVVLSYQVRASCSPKEREKNYTHMYDHLTKTYKWKMSNNIIIIEGLDKYKLTTSMLTSEKEVLVKDEGK